MIDKNASQNELFSDNDVIDGNKVVDRREEGLLQDCKDPVFFQKGGCCGPRSKYYVVILFTEIKSHGRLMFLSNLNDGDFLINDSCPPQPVCQPGACNHGR